MIIGEKQFEGFIQFDRETYPLCKLQRVVIAFFEIPQPEIFSDWEKLKDYCFTEIETACKTEDFDTIAKLSKNIVGWRAAFYKSFPQMLSRDEHVIKHITQEINTLFDRQAAQIYSELLEKTGDINAQYEGWTLLHYCVYYFSYRVPAVPKSLLALYINPPNPEENGGKLLNLMEYLIRQGGDISIADCYGRTPHYFASTLYAQQKQLNERYWSLVQIENIFPVFNECVHPLHVITSLTEKYVIDFIEKGAEMDPLDQYGRTPLHCAITHSQFDEELYNVRAFIYYAPSSLEIADTFGNFPLFYAAVFGTEDLFNLVLEYSSCTVISAVLEKLQSEPHEDEESLKENYKINDPIYNVPKAFQIIYGAGKQKSKKKEKTLENLQNGLDNKKTTYVKEGIPYDTWHDGHGWKHVIHPTVYKKNFPQKRDFIKSTQTTPAKFFPEVFEMQTYESFIENCIKAWADKGADGSNLFVDYGRPIGADNGNSTNWVEIYFTSSGGAHVRPKYCD